MIVDQYVDPEETMKLTQCAQQEIFRDAAGLTGLILNHDVSH
jgi:hypothetical protein